MKTNCEHINNDNERDCEEDAEVMCKCCAMPMCEQHAGIRCQWGGERFIEIND